MFALETAGRQVFGFLIFIRNFVYNLVVFRQIVFVND